jgi:hypothetical protein
MHRTVSSVLDWRVEAWEEPSGDAAASQDSLLILPDPAGRLRVAVLDGVTPTRATRTVVGVDGAMYAAAVARLALQRMLRPLEECVLAANRHLFAAGVARSRDQAQTCVTAADIYPDGRLEVVRAGDCEAWARIDGRGWVALGTGPALTPRVATEWDSWQRHHAGVTRDERHRAEEAILGRPDAWTSTALGRFESPRVRRFTASDVTELVLASDGARLSERVLVSLDGWLQGLRAWEARRGAIAGEKVHDDVTVLRVSRRAAASLGLAA